MENNHPDQSEKQNENNYFSQATDYTKKAYDTVKKTIKIARLLSSLFPSWVLIVAILGIIVGLYFFIMFFGVGAPIPGGSSPKLSGSSNTVPTIPGFNIEIEGPESKENGALLQYTVTITHNPTVAPPIESIEVFDTLPTGAELEGTTGKVKDPNANPHVWPLSESSNKSRFDITIRPNQTDTRFNYTVSARVIASAGNSTSTNDCSGNYNLTKNPLQANFGDPSCTLTRNDLHKRLEALDPTNADYWYQLVSCETGTTFDPNAFNPISTSGTAWGLFQMGHEAYPNLGIIRQMNNNYDRGDVLWEKQATNAVAYNQLRNNDFAYWGCP